ncbi:MAG: GGDEF domain-containing protein, partial [Acidimicrobiia bacterium]
MTGERDPQTAATAPLISSQSGMENIYLALDELVSAYDLDDAAIIIEEQAIGRQVFRAGRTPIENGASPLLQAEPGLYTSPALPQPFDSAAFLNACELALHLEMLRYDAWHDSLTGLFDRRSFEHLLETSVARSRRYDWG